MATIRQRGNKWEAKLRVPTALVEEVGRKMLYRTLRSLDRRSAELEAKAWELELKAGWHEKLHGTAPTIADLRALYERVKEQAERGDFVIEGDPEAYDEFTAGIEHELEKLEEDIGRREFTDAEQARVAALQDAQMVRQGRRPAKRAELEMSFREIADAYLNLWRTTAGLKETNTEQQKRATFELFAAFHDDRPIRQVSRGDAASFFDQLRQLDPNWARTGKKHAAGYKIDWRDLQRRFGGRARGLSDNTVNRHANTLSELWRWAEGREHCEGKNPFDGHRRSIRPGKNKHGYVAWTTEELLTLFSPPPKRDDLTEVMIVALFTGMRLNEIASLTFGQFGEEGGVRYIDVTDAKTTAGIRKVPLHRSLGWLWERADGANASERVWPKFSPEGPGRKPGGDAGKDFSRFKRGRGFEDRTKVFHSFRKNFVGQLEEAGVPQNEVAEIVGHEKAGMTFGVYGRKLSLQRMAEVVSLIDYPGVPIPMPDAQI